jgi:hypothetical protein
MTSEEFIARAEAISADPLSRVPERFRPLAQSGRAAVDCHCHLFNEETVPKALYNMKMPGGPLFHHLATRIARALHLLNRRSSDDWGSRNAYFIETFLKSTPEIAEKFTGYYPDSTNTIFTPLMMDMHNRASLNNRERAEYYIRKQAVDITGLLNDTDRRYNLLPFLPVDPTIADSDGPGFNHFDLFIRAFNGEYGFTPFGIKIYPSLGYLPSHPLLMPVYEVCEKKRIPVTAHCSTGTVHAYFRRIKNIPGWKITSDGTLTDRPETRWFILFQKIGYENYFNHPKNWEPVLERFPDLKINFAHFGGYRQWRQLIKGNQNNWVSRIFDYFARYPNVFADLSYTNAFPDINRAAADILNSSRMVRERTLYGFDWYMVVREGHYRGIKACFDTLMGEEIIDYLSRKNPYRFLFG